MILHLGLAQAGIATILLAVALPQAGMALKHIPGKEMTDGSPGT